MTSQKTAKQDGPTVLVVDDNQHMRVLLIEVLRAIGVGEVREASDGSEALNVLRQRRIDLVICDLAMQPVDGIDFVRLLRTSPDSPDQMVPVIIVSGHSTASKVYEARDAGANEFLVKPITARGVLDRIARVIHQPRDFVRSTDYVGPDRRRKDDPNYEGPWRRAGDQEAVPASVSRS
ncbi:MAG TPA: response regulator [Caulobacteraceae bacterium]|jgi:CheY-like chemotaxis protein